MLSKKKQIDTGIQSYTVDVQEIALRSTGIWRSKKTELAELSRAIREEAEAHSARLERLIARARKPAA